MDTRIPHLRTSEGLTLRDQLELGTVVARWIQPRDVRTGTAVSSHRGCSPFRRAGWRSESASFDI